ncbi:hypothetical protein HHK36_019492 [Tetracentron sinense]|uniref:RanBP2-type domain-containing protein n=1 Tax=Tetracentron sinense TaxID=13715 RepID=A0A834YTV7_TETSI|nr:hypothetical protein HHK36_019492 [Tetracentron sinense]
MGGASKLLMLLTTPFPFLYPRPSLLRLARHSRVSLSSFSHNPFFSSNSGPHLGFRSEASEQIHSQTTSVSRDDYFGDSIGFSPNPNGSHPWPEWLNLVENLRASGYFDRLSSSLDVDEDAFLVIEDLPDEFIRAANACLLFARHRSDLLGMLSREDIEIVVENGSPFLFKNAADSTRRMRSFLGSSGSNLLIAIRHKEHLLVLAALKSAVKFQVLERVHTVDLMRFLLSYACNPSLALDRNNLHNRELVESSVRNLLSKLAEISRTVPESDLSGSMPKQFPVRNGQSLRPLHQNIAMKRGDWICPKCSFMNFAKNMKCLECDEARPKKQLAGGEWECPQCDFYNYGRNIACLRCDCKRPGEALFGTSNPRSGLGYNTESYPRKVDAESRLAVNDEKAERWFNKVSQLDNSSDLSSAITDEDFPEIMPLRKGVNRFVVSTRKTPLERRLANAQYRRNLGNDGTPEGNNYQAGDTGGLGPNKSPDTSISRSLDKILGRSSAVSETDGDITASEETNTGIERPPISSSPSPQYRQSKGSNSGYVPFVPLPADMFAKPQKSKLEDEQVADNYDSIAARASEQTGSFSGSTESGSSGDDLLFSEKPVSQKESKDDKEQAEKSERWFKKVAELHDVTDLASAISDEDFPEIMPMRKGENRFVVSKKKDRSLTSPLYKRRIAMEQASSTNFAPFVPFPPDYFAKKNKQPDAGASTENSVGQTYSISATPEKLPGVPGKSDESNSELDDKGSSGISGQGRGNQQTSTDSWNTRFSGKGLNESKTNAVYGTPAKVNSTQEPNILQTNSRGSWNSESSEKESTSDVIKSTRGSSQQIENPQNSTESWNRGFSGNSLEGSAVKEPDPLDMSEEAKAERWFRRVAQIKDISELSQIPDEDFPEIMPMRKGVNRFVVSKRKTPLERRLTSPQYRRNLPIISSDPVKKENDTS